MIFHENRKLFKYYLLLNSLPPTRKMTTVGREISETYQAQLKLKEMVSEAAFNQLIDVIVGKHRKAFVEYCTSTTVMSILYISDFLQDLNDPEVDERLKNMVDDGGFIHISREDIDWTAAKMGRWNISVKIC